MPHKLLLADDSVTIQRVIELTFADEDIRVIAVGDGKQAIERLQSERPDIVLADVGMPERDGYEVATYVKQHPEFANVPVLLLTGAFEPIDEGRARAAGCDGVLVKPFEPQMVINRVKDLLAGRRPAGLWAAVQSNHPGAPPQSPAAPPARPAAPSTASPDLDLRRGPAPGQPSQEGGSLEDYFDRLDAAFAELDSSSAAAPQTPVQLPSPSPAPSTGDLRGNRHDFGGADVLADWDPELTGDPTRPSRSESPLFETEAHRLSPPAPVGFAPAVAAPPPAPPAATPPPVAVTPAPAPEAPAAPPAAVAAPPPPAAPAVTLPQGPSLADAFAALLAAEQGQPVAPSALRHSDVPEKTIEEIVRRVLDRVTGDSVRGIVLEVAERLVREEIARIKRG